MIYIRENGEIKPVYELEYYSVCPQCGVEVNVTDEYLDGELPDVWGTSVYCPRCSAAFAEKRDFITANVKQAVQRMSDEELSILKDLIADKL